MEEKCIYLNIIIKLLLKRRVGSSSRTRKLLLTSLVTSHVRHRPMKGSPIKGERNQHDQLNYYQPDSLFLFTGGTAKFFLIKTMTK